METSQLPMKGFKCFFISERGGGGIAVDILRSGPYTVHVCYADKSYKALIWTRLTVDRKSQYEK